MTQLAQRFGFDLADALARYRKNLAYFFERVFIAIVQTKTHLDDSLFAWSERPQHRGNLILQIEFDSGVRGRQDRLILDEIPQMRISRFSNGSLERHRYLRNF